MVKESTMDELVATWTMPNIWTATSYSYNITDWLEGSLDTYTLATPTFVAPTASGVPQTFTQTVTPAQAGSGMQRLRAAVQRRSVHSG